jgi:general stress protein CsbA
MIANWIRIILTIALLFPVWNNSHWSVALSITLLVISVELSSFLIRQQQKKSEDEEKIKRYLGL